MFHVTDTDLSGRFPIYTRANVGGVFPDPVTPLTSDTALWIAELDATRRIPDGAMLHVDGSTGIVTVLDA